MYQFKFYIYYYIPARKYDDHCTNDSGHMSALNPTARHGYDVPLFLLFCFFLSFVFFFFELWCVARQFFHRRPTTQNFVSNNIIHCSTTHNAPEGYFLGLYQLRFCSKSAVQILGRHIPWHASPTGRPFRMLIYVYQVYPATLAIQSGTVCTCLAGQNKFILTLCAK